MRILTIFSTILLIIVSSIMIYGFSLNSQTEIEEMIIVEAPPAVVWNSLADFNEHNKWLQSIKVLYNYKNTARQVHYNFGDKTILVNQQVRVRAGAKAIDYFQIGNEKFSDIEGLSGQINLVVLPDGNSEIHWKIMYSLNTLSQKVIAKFSVEKRFRALIGKNLIAFKNFIED